MPRGGAFRENQFTSKMDQTLLLLQTLPCWESRRVRLNSIFVFKWGKSLVFFFDV